MRMSLAAVTLAMLATQAARADGERDPYSGAPLPPQPRASASPLTDSFYVRAGYYQPQVRTRLRLDPSAAPGTGTPINAESDLGLADQLHQGRVEFMFRLRERGKMRVDYFQSERSGAPVLAKDIVFGGTTFPAGQLTLTELNLHMFDLTYSYSVWRSDRLEAGTGLGLYFLEAEARALVPARNLSQEESGAQPFPALPLDLAWRISSRFAFTARAAYLRATLNRFRGWFADLHEDAQYRWNDNLALGLGYSAIRSSLTRRGGSLPGAFSMSISGPEAFVRFSF